MPTFYYCNQCKNIFDHKGYKFEIIRKVDTFCPACKKDGETIILNHTNWVKKGFIFSTIIGIIFIIFLNSLILFSNSSFNDKLLGVTIVTFAIILFTIGLYIMMEMEDIKSLIKKINALKKIRIKNKEKIKKRKVPISDICISIGIIVGIGLGAYIGSLSYNFFYLFLGIFIGTFLGIFIGAKIGNILEDKHRI